jgi:hypothetical protein
MAVAVDNRIRTMRVSRIVPDDSRTKFVVSHQCSQCKREETKYVDLEHLDALLCEVYHCEQTCCPSNNIRGAA